MTMTAPAPTGRRKDPSRRPVLTFVREFVANPTRVGAVLPSSKRLSRAMLDGLDIAGAKVIVEFGPGTGVVTDQLAPLLKPGCTYFAIERSEDMARVWQARHPNLKIHVDTAANVAELCRRNGVDQVDIVLSGLPWSSLPDEVVGSILNAMGKVLRPGGVFVTFCYYTGTWLPGSKRFFRRLPALFSRVEKGRHVMRNVPPAFVLRCTK
jgi:phosphatidylethanolamine/phosphatidyl-N-methylethanolamine N-methyltransferase